MKPLYGQYKVDTRMYNNPKQIKMATEKKKFDWRKIWQIVRDIILALLAADTVNDKIQ